MKKVILKTPFLVVAASSDAVLNEQIAEDVAENQLVNVITNPESGNVHFPAAIHRGLLNVAVFLLAGASPKLAKKIRDDIANKRRGDMMRRMNRILIFYTKLE